MSLNCSYQSLLSGVLGQSDFHLHVLPGHSPVVTIKVFGDTSVFFCHSY